jgi:hypothetical protein
MYFNSSLLNNISVISALLGHQYKDCKVKMALGSVGTYGKHIKEFESFSKF